MQIPSVTPDLARFLELKKAAEKRMAVSGTAPQAPAAAPRKAGTADAPASSPFMDLIKALRGGTDAKKNESLNMAPVSRNPRAAIAPRTTSPMHFSSAPQKAAGLLSAYTVSRLAGEAVSAAGAPQEAAPTAARLGKFFDAVA